MAPDIPGVWAGNTNRYVMAASVRGTQVQNLIPIMMDFFSGSALRARVADRNLEFFPAVTETNPILLDILDACPLD